MYQHVNTSFKLNTEHTKPPAEAHRVGLFRHSTSMQALSLPRLRQFYWKCMLSGVLRLGKPFLAHQQPSLVLSTLGVVMDRCIVGADAFSKVGECQALALDTHAWGRTSASGCTFIDRLVSQAVGRPLHGVSGCGHGDAEPLAPSLCIQTESSRAVH